MNDSSRLSFREQKDSLSDRQASTSTSASSFVDVKDSMKVDDKTVFVVSFKLSSWRERADSAWEISMFCEKLSDVRVSRDEEFRECMTFSTSANDSLIFSAAWDNEIHDMMVDDEHIVERQLILWSKQNDATMRM